MFAEGVKEVDNTAKIGGYGSVGHDWINYVYSFLTYYKGDANKPPMDFFSFHQYGKPSWEYVPEIEKAFTDKGLPVPDLYLTEWNNSYGKNEGEGTSGVPGGGFDTNVNASYVAKKMYHTMEYENLKKIYFWNFADADPSKKFNGDAGLFTVDRHRKAAANTFMFYNNMHASVVSSSFFGYGTEKKDLYGFVTVDHATSKIAMIIWNHQKSTYLLRTTINKIPALAAGKEYTVKKLRIDSKNGNYYYDYMNGFTGTGTGPNENAKVVETFKFKGGSFTHADTLKAYSVVQLLIEPE
ncbi:MAG: hypothetical protein HC830_10000 [Bacteroidetes bacterium]|nr:hypothetical protein [Bacteroidota bacterium]